MAEGGTQYDLRLGLDTGPAKPAVEGLNASLVQTGQTADVVQRKLDTVSTSAARLGTVSSQSSAGVASVARASDTLVGSVARVQGTVASASGAVGGLASSVAAADRGMIAGAASANVLSFAAKGIASSTAAASLGLASMAPTLAALEASTASLGPLIPQVLGPLSTGIRSVITNVSASSLALGTATTELELHRAASLQDSIASGSLAGALEKEILGLKGATLSTIENVTAQRALLTSKRVYDDSLKAGLINQQRHAELLGLARKRFEELNAPIKASTFSLGNLKGMLAGIVAILALIGFTRVIGELRQFSQESVQASLTIQRAQTTLKAVTGSAEVAAEDIAFLRAESNRLGLVFEDQIAIYARLAAATRGTALAGQGVRDVFTGMAEAAAVYNLSSEDTRGALNALQQMISKGRVSAEELVQQLGERMPGALQIAARAMNKTTQDLLKMAEAGEVLPVDFVARFGAQLRKELADQVPAATQRAEAAFNRLENTVFDLKVAFGDALMPVLVEGARLLVELLKAAQDAGLIEHLADVLKVTADFLALFNTGAREANEHLGTLTLSSAAAHPQLYAVGFAIRHIGDAIKFAGDNVVSQIPVFGRLYSILSMIADSPAGKLLAALADKARAGNAAAAAPPKPKPGAGGPVSDPFAADEAAYAKYLQEQAKALGEVTVRSGQAVGAARALYRAHQEGLPAVLAATRAQVAQEAALPFLMKEQYDAAKAAAAAAVAQFDLERATDMLVESQDAAAEMADAVAAAEARVADALAGNSVASQKAAREAEVEAFRKQGLLAVGDDLVEQRRRDLETRDASINAANLEADAILRDIDYSNSLRTAQAELEDARTGGVSAQREAARWLEIEGRLMKEGAVGDQKKTAAIIAEVTARRRTIDAIEDQTGAESRLREMRRGTLGMRAIAAVDRNAFETVREYEEALRAANLELQIQQMVEDELAKETKPELIAQMEAEMRTQAALNEEALKSAVSAKTATEQWLIFADALADNFGGAGSQIAEIAGGLAEVIRGLVAAREAADAFGRAQGWAAAAQGVFAVAEALGLLEQNVTAGGFGASGEGNYASEGQAAGAVIGAVIGAAVAAYFTGGMGAAQGAQVGAAIGAAAGGIIGSFIKKGADEALGRLELDSGDIVAVVTKNEGSLGRVIRELGQRISDAIHDVLDILGAEMVDIPKVSIKVRDGIISVWVGAVNARVKEMDEAIAFAITEILKQADISGLSDTMRTVLQNTVATSLDQLTKDLDFGRWYERIGLGEAAVAIEDQLADFRMRFRQAVELGLDTAPIGEWLAEQFQGLRDNVLGIQLSPEEQLRQNVEAFNQQLAIIKAEQEVRRADLLLRKAELEAQLAIAQANYTLTHGEIDIGRARMEVRAAMLDAEGQMVDAEGAILMALLEALGAVDAALESVELILGSLPDLISDEELQAAMRRLRGAGGHGGRGADTSAGPNLQDVIDESNRRVADAGLGDFGRQVSEINQRFDDAIESAGDLDEAERRVERQRRDAIRAAHGNAEAIRKANAAYERQMALIEGTRAEIDEANRARQRELDLVAEGIRDSAKPYLSPERGGTFGLSPWELRETEIDEMMAGLIEGNEALVAAGHAAALSQEELAEIERNALAGLAEEAIDSLGLPLEQTRDKIAAWKGTLDFLRRAMESGAISADHYGRIIAETAQQAEVEFLTLAQSILDTMGATEQSEALKSQLAEANFLMQVAQLNLLYEALSTLGAVGEELQKRLAPILGFINDPKNWPDFNAPPVQTSPGGGGGGGGSDDPFRDIADLLDEIRDQVREWTGAIVGPLERSAREMRDRLADLEAQAVALFNYGAGQLLPALAELQAAYAAAVQHFVNETVASFVRVPESVQAARDLRDRILDAQAALTTLGASAEQFAQLQAATQGAIEDFVDDALRDTERLGNSPLANELADINQQFDELRAAFETLGVSADQMARLEQARVLALEDFWRRATEGIRSLIEEMRANDPRVSSQSRFLTAQERFRDLQARAAGGDLEALEQLRAAADEYRAASQGFLGSGVGSQRIFDEILHGLEQVADAGVSENNPVAIRLGETNDILFDIRALLGGEGYESPPWHVLPESPATAIRPYGGVARRPRPGEDDHPSGGDGGPIRPVSGEDGYASATMALLRQIEEKERRRAEEAKVARRSRAVAEAEDSQQRDRMMEVLAELGATMEALRKELKDQRAAAGS